MSTSRFFRNAVTAFIAARERQAEREVSNALLMFDDATLAQYGYSRSELKKQAPRVGF